MVDTRDLKSLISNGVRVRVPSAAPIYNLTPDRSLFFWTRKIFLNLITIMSLNKNKIIILTLSGVFFLTSISVYSFGAAKDYFFAKSPNSPSATAQSQNLLEEMPIIHNLKSKTISLGKSNLQSVNTVNGDTEATSTKQISNSTSENKKPNNEIEVKIIESVTATTVSPSSDSKLSPVTPQKQNNPKPVEATSTVIPGSIGNPPQPTTNAEIAKYKVFEGSQWKDLYEKAKLSYENITNDYTGLNYFGEDNVNQVAIDLATKRGFTKRSLVADQSQLVNVEGYLIQPKMADSIKELFKEMRDNGLSITFLSGFRGIPEQSTVFGEEFYKQSIINRNREISNQEILDRKADGVFNKSYDTVALPGYSRHHYGYTIDVTEPGTYYKSFESTKAYEWMSRDNFYNVKKHGLIPSYPKGVEYQGPEPESWEFVYVGTENLLR
jgi:D-alanyl-D-alanine carboxypeptidase